MTRPKQIALDTRLDRKVKLERARATLGDREIHSPARLRRACLSVLNHSPASNIDERREALDLLASLQPQTPTQPEKEPTQ